MAVGNQDAEAQGLDYISNNQYLQDDFTGSTPLDFSNVSSSGIMSQAPIPGPLKYIPEGDGGGGKPPGPGPDLGGITADDYGYGLVEDMGMTEEEQAGVDSIKNAKMSKMDALKAAGAFAFMGPFAGIFSAYRSQKKAREEAVAAAKNAQQQRNAEIGADKGTGPDGSGSRRGNADISDDARGGFATDDTASFFAKGGRVGYFFGGRVNYKVGGRVSFKNGGLASIL